MILDRSRLQDIERGIYHREKPTIQGIFLKGVASDLQFNDILKSFEKNSYLTNRVKFIKLINVSDEVANKLAPLFSSTFFFPSSLSFENTTPKVIDIIMRAAGRKSIKDLYLEVLDTSAVTAAINNLDNTHFTALQLDLDRNGKEKIADMLNHNPRQITKVCVRKNKQTEVFSISNFIDRYRTLQNYHNSDKESKQRHQDSQLSLNQQANGRSSTSQAGVKHPRDDKSHEEGRATKIQRLINVADVTATAPAPAANRNSESSVASTQAQPMNGNADRPPNPDNCRSALDFFTGLSEKEKELFIRTGLLDSKLKAANQAIKTLETELKISKSHNEILQNQALKYKTQILSLASDNESLKNELISKEAQLFLSSVHPHQPPAPPYYGNNPAFFGSHFRPGPPPGQLMTAQQAYVGPTPINRPPAQFNKNRY